MMDDDRARLLLDEDEEPDEAERGGRASLPGLRSLVADNIEDDEDEEAEDDDVEAIAPLVLLLLLKAGGDTRCCWCC